MLLKEIFSIRVASLPSSLIRNSCGSGYTSVQGAKYQYGQAAPKPSYKSAYSVPSPAKSVYLELNKGDMVQHTAFGRGMVLSVVKMGGDALLEIAFDQIGTKKLMAKTASVHMKRL